tara:strand:- start:1520 stop:1885 length:366 start_codon:yes stop_codon:yes gene_type:complete
MPAQDKLIQKLQTNPPDNFAELETMMQDCGYGVTVTDPSASDEAYSDEGSDGEYSEEAGPEDVEMAEESSEMAEDPMEMFAHVLPPYMGKPHDNEHPRSKVRRMTMIAAHKATKPEDEGEQ